jgi:transcriptional regulator GlxA family with amidase domain
VCTGAFLVARAGLLDGRRATTHWSAAAELARRHPRVRVDADPIFLRDGHVWTSAGVTAGMDLALALVEEDLDRDAALTIARHLVLFLRRPGNQSQFSATLAAQEPVREPLREAQRLVLEHVAGEHSVEAMAIRAHMSPRHFARAFRAETGLTPGRYVERVRLEAARRRLEDTAEPIAAIAVTCGFGTAETMRRVFLRLLGVGPAEYRRRFQALSASSRAAA